MRSACARGRSSDLPFWRNCGCGKISRHRGDSRVRVGVEKMPGLCGDQCPHTETISTMTSDPKPALRSIANFRPRQSVEILSASRDPLNRQCEEVLRPWAMTRLVSWAVLDQ